MAEARAELGGRRQAITAAALRYATRAELAAQAAAQDLTAR